MFCETCGKKLIRGYSFCVDCGTPVPPGAFDEEEDTPPVEELKPGMGTDEDSMPGIQPKRSASVEGGNLSSGSGVPLFNTDNTGLGGLGIGGDPDQAIVNLFGTPSSPSGVSAIGGFNSASSSIAMPSIEAPAKTTQAKQKEPEKGEERLMNDFSMSADSGDDTLEVTDRAVKVLGGVSMDENVGADIDLSPYKFLDNKIEIGEPEPAYEEPEPIAVEPEPIAVEPEPIAVEPEPIAVEPEPIAVEPEPIAVEPEPIAVEPEPIAVEPEPIAVEPEPVPVEPEPIAVEPEPIAVEPEPVPVQPESVPVEPEPAAAEPEPAAAEQEPVYVEPEPVPAEPKSAAAEPEPAAAEPVAVAPVAAAVEAPKAPEVPEVDIDDFIPEEISVIEESSPFIDEASITPEPPKAAEPEKPEASKSEPSKPEKLPEPLHVAPPKTASDPKPSPNSNTEPSSSPQKGKLVYCRTCGQDMYDTDKVCKNCGAPYKGAYVAPKQKQEKQSKKLFGVLPLPAVIGVASVVVVMTALIIFLSTRGDNNSVPVVGEVSNVPSSTTSAVVSSSGTPVESSTPDVSSSVTSDPVESTTGETSSVEPQSSVVVSSNTPVSSKPTPPPTPPVSSSKPPVTPPPAPPSNVMTNGAKAYETDRLKLIDAAAVIAGEEGKIHSYATIMTDAAEREYAITPRLKNALLKDIESGRSKVTTALNGVYSVNSALASCKNFVIALRERYDAYYNYVKSTNVLDAGTCRGHFMAFEQALKNVRYNQFTTSYNSNDKNLGCKAVENNTTTLINDTFSLFYKLRDSFSKTALNYEDSAYNELANNATLFCNAAASVYKVKAYGLLANDSSYINGNYNKLDDHLEVYIELYDYAGNYNKFYNDAY